MVAEGKTMTGHTGWRKRRVLACLGAGLAPALLIPALALAQGRGNNAAANANANANPRPNDLAQGPALLPPTPPQGAWGEVIMANTKWLVVQNHEGQQFPIAMDAITQFLVRWPTSFDALTPATVVEAIGQDMGSNVLRTEHVDVFEGADRSLVAPTYTNLLPNNRVVTTVDPGYNRFMNGFDIGAQNLQHGWAYPVVPGELGIPGRLHIVGNAIGVNPLRVGVLGNNFATVLPVDGGGMSITQMTRGTATFAEKGDLIYLMPTDLTPRTVTLAQAVLYKKIPLRQFRLP
jgi:hypothetical protein